MSTRFEVDGRLFKGPLINSTSLRNFSAGPDFAFLSGFMLSERAFGPAHAWINAVRITSTIQCTAGIDLADACEYGLRLLS